MTEVRIHHPRWDRTLTVPAELWPGRLAGKGWELADDQTLPPPPAPVDPAPAEPATADDIITTPPTPDLSEKEQLQQVLRDRGVSFHHRLGVEKLRKLVEDTE